MADAAPEDTAPGDSPPPDIDPGLFAQLAAALARVFRTDRPWVTA
jgi:hypothetical protein